jgi:hypothetical protein
MEAPAINLHLGQRVTIISKHCSPGTTGKIEHLQLAYSGDGGHDVPMATVLLDKYIQLPERTLSDGYKLPATTICRQTVPVDEVLPYDFRDDAIASLRDAAELLGWCSTCAATCGGASARRVTRTTSRKPGATGTPKRWRSASA